MSFANIAEQIVTSEDRAELYDHLAEITPSLDRAINYKATAENIRENERVLAIRRRRMT